MAERIAPHWRMQKQRYQFLGYEWTVGKTSVLTITPSVSAALNAAEQHKANEDKKEENTPTTTTLVYVALVADPIQTAAD